MSSYWSQLTRDLEEQLDWFIGHHPEILEGKYDIEAHGKFPDNLIYVYEWKDHLRTDGSLISVEIDNCSARILDEMCIFLIKRVSTLRRKDYLIIVNNENKTLNITVTFKDLIDFCEEKEIALKIFYNQLQIYVNPFWIK